MAPSILQLSTQLRQIIYYHLDNDLLQNALFLAERLHGLDPRSHDALHLLALCHLRQGEHKIAYDYIRLVALKGLHLPCSYVFAQVCLQLNKNAEGISALERARPLWNGRNSLYEHSNTVRKHMPDAAAVYYLLGKLFHGDSDVKRAVDCYAESLKLNPFMWDAFECLCDTGANIRTSNIFKISTDMISNLSTVMPHSPLDHSIDQENTASIDKLLQAETQSRMAVSIGDPFTSNRTMMDNALTERLGAIPQPAETMQRLPSLPREREGMAPDFDPPNAPSRKPRRFQSAIGELGIEATKSRTLSSRELGRAISEDIETSQNITVSTIPNQHKRTVSGSLSHHSNTTLNPPGVTMPQRRSRRLFGKPPITSASSLARDSSDMRKLKATGTRGRGAALSTVGRVVSGNRKPIEMGDSDLRESRTNTEKSASAQASQKAQALNASTNIEALQWLLELLDRLGSGYRASSQFQCRAALQHYHSAPQSQRETAWVLTQIGKNLHEHGRYAEAERVFVRLRKRVPARMLDMEAYSTVLWHLKRDTELAFLAHEPAGGGRSAPQAWCAVGNSFSLQRDHEQALKCFRRATQLKPDFAYGFTLQGHEHSANEEYEKALQAYRRAIRADHRHYNGWYGLAKVYEKLGKFAMAEEHYKAAASVNPTNAVLIWSIGMVLEKQKKPQAALAHYQQACELAPSSAMPRFKKARVLLNLQRFEEALDEFNVLKDMVPDESNVHFMLGKVHKQLRNKSEAVKHFTIALNLDPKAAPYIKETMESIDQEDEDMSDDDVEDMP